MNPVHLGILINSALYLGGCIAAGLVTGHRFAWTLAIAAAGVAYLCYCAQATGWRRISELLFFLSVAMGVGAGIALLPI